MKLLFWTASVFISFLSIVAVFYKQPFIIQTTRSVAATLNSYIDNSDYFPASFSRHTPRQGHNHLNGDHLEATDMSVPRAIRKVFLASEQAEGVGARVRRSVGTPALRNFSPFLMLDHVSISPGAGFPDQYVSSPLLPLIPWETCEFPNILSLSFPLQKTTDTDFNPTALIAVRRPSPTSSRAAWTTRTLPATRAHSPPATCSS
jgi:hypothetical protein